ncbi:MAG: hypothetical protein FWD35_04585, partial [Oscillospiraceae bacterium]|nr:hypothetical protein [Oscillospiraceae bacterium]
KMVIGSVDVIYSLLAKLGNGKLTAAVTEFFTYSVYTAFRLVFRANPKNDANFFAFAEDEGFRSASAGRLICEGKAIASADEAAKFLNTEQLPAITAANLEYGFGKQAVALMSLVKSSEKLAKS